MRGLARAALLQLAALGAACGRPSGHRAVLVGVDGADPDIVAGLAAEGKLPHLARMAAEGASGSLRSREPLLSPIVWTTIATGRKPPDHGILDFVEPAADRQLVPITNRGRRVPAFWNVLSEFGRSVSVVGWYASYPAEGVNGFLVSDRLGFHQVKSAPPGPGATFPEGLAAEIRASVGAAVPDVEATRARFVNPGAPDPGRDGGRRLERLAEVYATTEFYRKAARYLHERRVTDLTAVYFEWIDACGHLFMEDAPPRRPGVSDGDYAAFSGTVERCYRYQDEVLGDVLDWSHGSAVFVVSDHGFKTGDQRPRTSGRADTGLAPLWHKTSGVILVAGPGVRPGSRLTGAGILDVMPTLMAWLGVPVSRELPGSPLQQAFAADAWPGVRHVNAYAAAPRTSAAAAGADAADADRVERLRALGYVAGDAAPPDAAAGRTVASWVNEGMSRSADGDEAGALEDFTRARELDPRNLNARVFASRVLIRQGRLTEAKQLLDEASALDPNGVGVRLQWASWAVEARQWERAQAELAAAAALDDRLPQVHVLKGRLAQHLGRSQQALEELGAAAALADAEPLRAEIFYLEAQVTAELGRADEAEKALEQARQLGAPAPPAALRGDIALARGDWAQAARLYEEALAAKPRDSVLERKRGQALAGANRAAAAEAAFRAALTAAANDGEREGAWGDLALLFQKLGREQESREALLAATQALPRSAPLWAMLGAAWGRADRREAAISAYERSVALSPTALACKTLAALVFSERKDVSRAVSLWRQSLALDPDQPDVQAFLARYYEH